MRLKNLITASIGGLLLANFPVWAADDSGTNSTTETEIQALKQEIQALDQKVEALQGRQVADQKTATAAAKKQPLISLGQDGVTLSSPDTNFVIGLHGLVQLDSRTFFADHNIANSGFLLRRARPIITGTVFHDYDFNFTPEFGGNTVQILDAYINYHPWTELQLEGGKFKPPVGLEALQTEQYTLFNERSLATDLVPYRDIGAELHGDLFGGRVSYAAGIFDGAPDYNTTTTNTDYDNDKAFEGRLFFQPWKTTDVRFLQGLGFGLGGSYESDRAATNTATGLTPGFTTDGQQKFFTYSSGVYAKGTHWRLSPQGYYYWGPLGLMGEYVISDQVVSKGSSSADLHNTAWEVSGSWVLTGEDASYNGVIPNHPFSLHDWQWGAWQIAARYAQLDVDKDAFPTFASSASSAQSAHAWSVGLNWYLNRNIRFNTSFSRTTFFGYTGGVPAVPAQPEECWFTRLQLSF